MSSSPTEPAEAVLDAAGGAAALPASVAQLARAAEPAAADVARLIESDPQLAARVVRIASSPLVGATSRAESLDEAVSRLGPGGVRDCALLAALCDMFRGGICSPDDAESRIWLHNLASAILAGLLAVRYQCAPPEEALLAGVLNGVPIGLLHGHDPSGYARAAEHQAASGCSEEAAEEAAFGTNRGAVGTLLAGRWHLPEHLAAAVSDQAWRGVEAPYTAQGPSLLQLVHLARHLVCMAGLEPVAGLHQALRDPREWRALGIDIAEAGGALADVGPHLRELAECLELPLPEARDSVPAVFRSTASAHERQEATDAFVRHARERLDDLDMADAGLARIPRVRNMEQALELIGSEVLAPLGYACTALYTPDRDIGLLVPFAAYGSEGCRPEDLSTVPMSASTSAIARVHGGAPPALVADAFGPPASSDAVPCDAVAGLRGVRTHGVLICGSGHSGRALTRLDLAAVATVARQIGAVLDHCAATLELDRRAGELGPMAIHDRETRVYNKQFLVERLEDEIARSQRTGRPFAIVVVRLTNYADIAKHGELSRLDTLIRVVETASARLRGADMLFRHEEDCLCLVLPETARDAARIPAESLAGLLRDLDLSDILPAGEQRIESRWGTAGYPGDGETPDELLAAAHAEESASAGPGDG